MRTPPLQYLSGVGAQSASVVPLTWGLLIVSVAVTVIITVLLVWAIWRRRPVLEAGAVLPEGGGLNWLWIGGGLSTLALLITVGWTAKVLADIQAPPGSPGLSIEVTGKQWWWQIHYQSGGRDFVTANEIHVPVGVPVRLALVGGDVIHSFWVPQLAGKMDAIPGQINQTWLQANKPGIFAGQCTEYCGVQHSKMLLRVIAEPQADFQRWWADQLAAPRAAAGEKLFVQNCGNCHAVRGTDANGTMGPDLSHLMQRKTLASGVLPNDPQTLRRWITDPQSLKPGNRMPALPLSPAQFDAIHAYLAGLT
jgi:cytochrome c oxidase subunit 2